MRRRMRMRMRRHPRSVKSRLARCTSRSSNIPYWKQRMAVRFIVTLGVFALMLAAGLTSFHAFLMASGVLCYVRGVLKI